MPIYKVSLPVHCGKWGTKNLDYYIESKTYPTKEQILKSLLKENKKERLLKPKIVNSIESLKEIEASLFVKQAGEDSVRVEYSISESPNKTFYLYINKLEVIKV